MDYFKQESKTAIEAIGYAQWIVHAPMVFQATRVMRETGILKSIQEAGPVGGTIEEITGKVKLPHYGVRVLLESGLGIGLLLKNDDKYTLTKTGHFILNDKMTNVNMNFVHDVCYKGLYSLDESVKNEKPEGLKVFGEWKSVYEGLSELPDGIRKSWLEFDHYYSDDAFPLVLPLVFKHKPKKLLDIGGNTGKWSLACIGYDKDVSVTIVDLPGQIKLARQNIENKGALPARITFHGMNILSSDEKLPTGYDAIWMSQFLDCFSEEQIISILKRCHEAINENGFLFILEPFWDRQRFEAAAFALQQTSLYFTAIANGNSQMYHSTVFLKCIEDAGFEIAEQTDRIGLCHSLIKCSKKS
jgi:2-polyprenyl-3-methyl-5-hydroxy-6-metoxy-1,4-benzoquinol methylase